MTAQERRNHNPYMHALNWKKHASELIEKRQKKWKLKTAPRLELSNLELADRLTNASIRLEYGYHSIAHHKNFAILMKILKRAMAQDVRR
jgi:hypothetical protein